MEKDDIISHAKFLFVNFLSVGGALWNLQPFGLNLQTFKKFHWYHTRI